MPSEDPTDLAAAVERLKWRANLAERCADMSENELAADIRTVLAALRLQDAAPQLLAACKALINAPHQEHFAARLNDEEMDALRMIEAAIAAATGEGERP